MQIFGIWVIIKIYKIKETLIYLVLSKMSNRYGAIKMGKKRRKRTYTYVRGATKPLIRFRFKVVLVIFIIITAACFVIYMTGVNLGGDEEGTYTVTWKERTPEETTDSVKNIKPDNSSQNEQSEPEKITNPVPESSAMSQTYFGKCMFVGDSITVGLSDYQLVPMKNVIAEIGLNIEKINTETIQTQFGDVTALEALKQGEPENVYVMLGSNGIAWLTIEDMIAEYTEFLSEIRKALPETKIYILSIPPVTAAREVSEEPVSNATIIEYNSKLLELANENNYYYVDVHSALEDSEGVLSAEDAAEDGMHFNKLTYDKMISYILSHVVQ